MADPISIKTSAQSVALNQNKNQIENLTKLYILFLFTYFFVAIIFYKKCAPGSRLRSMRLIACMM